MHERPLERTLGLGKTICLERHLSISLVAYTYIYCELFGFIQGIPWRTITKTICGIAL
ncbi:hypothetical protein BDV32DRAFT_121820 [Aspergillus pseudonomiae]|nr:hypothetical protein BDV32DRAFT_121820 [Aspergillus pseudonomiae]